MKTENFPIYMEAIHFKGDESLIEQYLKLFTLFAPAYVSLDRSTINMG